MTVGDVLRAEMMAQGLTLAALAAKSGLATSVIHAATGGGSKSPRFATVVAICRGLGITLTDLEQRLSQEVPR